MPRIPTPASKPCRRRRLYNVAGIAFAILMITTCSPIRAAVESQGTRMHDCQLPNVSRPTLCGAVSVLEDPEQPNGKTLSIHFAIVKASSGHSRPDPIVVLMGGPGEEAIAAAADYTDEFKTLLDDRDLLLIDQRLTGQSATVRCRLFSPLSASENLHDYLPLPEVKRCKELLEPSTDLRRYTYPYFARDLEQLRQALGYGPVNLFSGSYGTRAAQAFIRRYPHSIRTNYLGSPVPIDADNPLGYAKTEDAALARTFINCEIDAACHAAFPNIRDEFKAIVARLDGGGVHVSVPGSTEKTTLSRGRVIEWFRSNLYRPKDAASIPWLIHRAFGGDWTSIVEGIVSGRRDADDDVSWGLFLSVTCSEDLPFITESMILAETKGAALSDYRIRQQQKACGIWPKAALSKADREPIQSDIPTLIVTGDQDGGTPLSFSERVAPGFTHHVTIVARGQGHTEWSECLAGLYSRLVIDGSVDQLKGADCPVVPLPPFKTI